MRNEFETGAPARELAFAAGTHADAAVIHQWLADLPAEAYGQVLIESDDAIDLMAAPAGIAVNRVPCGLEPGEGLARAVTAWFDEWIWAESDTDRCVKMWAGDCQAPAMRECWSSIDRKIARRRFAAGASICAADNQQVGAEH